MSNNEEKKVVVNAMSLKMSGEDQFSQDFNKVGQYYTEWEGDPDNDEKWDKYVQAKIALEQGYPIP